MKELSLKSQRRLAAKILKVGENRVWIDPDRIDYVEAVITREEIKRLIRENVIQAPAKKGVSRARARVLHEKKKKGRRRGAGVKSGTPHAKISKKHQWMKRIRSLRKKLRELKNRRTITQSVYRKLYALASGGVFKSITDMERYIKTNDLWRKR